MEERERTVLRRSRSVFTRDLVDVHTVCDRLYQREVLSEGMKSEILSETTRENQVRKLLDIIPKRGQKAYWALFDVLEETFQHDLSSILGPGGRISPHKLLDARSDVYTRSPDVPRLNSAMARQSLAESVHKYRSQPMESNWEAPSPPAPVKEVLDPTGTCGLCTETEREDPKQSNLKGEEKEEGFVLPEDWPSEQDLAQSINFEVRLSRKSRPRLVETEPDCYPMRGKARGRLVIINNFQFGQEVDVERMNRSQQDATSLDVLFKQLHFQTKQHSNLTLKKLSSVLEEERTRDQASLECFVMVVMSRGDGEHIYGVDGYRINTDSIISMFDCEHCSNLRGKPKIFIFQACNDATKSTDNFEKNYKKASMSSSFTLSDKLRSDMFILKATKDVEVRYGGAFGSRFIQSFVYLMRNLACEEDFQEIVTKINPLNATNEPEIVQYASSLTKRLFFNP
uniref:Caspase-6-like n=1 Tax=Crassostrea virginica TaxID=6565 RepID=A0A8B8A463_CRAVI|nr:caspase-6-like [Crassostrea virginica]